jgi:hypothetical protein
MSKFPFNVTSPVLSLLVKDYRLPLSQNRRQIGEIGGSNFVAD